MLRTNGHRIIAATDFEITQAKVQTAAYCFSKGSLEVWLPHLGLTSRKSPFEGRDESSNGASLHDADDCWDCVAWEWQATHQLNIQGEQQEESPAHTYRTAGKKLTELSCYLMSFEMSASNLSVWRNSKIEEKVTKEHRSVYYLCKSLLNGQFGNMGKIVIGWLQEI